jgi:chromate reductase, NAD(P)H dehydrogenase (quinone)
MLCRSFRSCRRKLHAVSLSVLCSLHRPFFSTSSTGAAFALNTVIITGTTRTEGPPRPILGPRVALYVKQRLEQRGHNVTAVLDPRELELPLLDKPHFAFSPGQVPELLQQIATQLEQADAFVTITPEYNHAPSPGLLNILNHFGSSKFSFKPSSIVTYSAGQWGGTRAAMALRPILSELGCLPVSAMIHIPRAQEVLKEDGSLVQEGEDDKKQWESYCDRCFSQLEWWGQAAANHRRAVNPADASPAFVKSPSQRNAP